MTDHRYPIEALADTMHDTVHGALKRLGVSGSTQQEYRARGVTHRVADRLAVRAGYHPAEIWPEIIDHEIEAAQTPCEECGEPFFPSRAGHRFCSVRCGERRGERRRYSERAEVAERIRARRRRYYAENAEYEKARERRRYRDRRSEAA